MFNGKFMQMSFQLIHNKHSVQATKYYDFMISRLNDTLYAAPPHN